MIGAAVLTLRAQNAGRLPFINGRLMHAAFFTILNEFAAGLGNFIHDTMNIKPFTVSFLDPAEKISSAQNYWQVRRGDKFLWRVTGLNAEILRTIMRVPIGYKIQVGALILSVENFSGDADFVAADDFIFGIKNAQPAAEICFEFVSPTTFRIDNFDAPYPRAELIFASLADKWTQADMPAAVDKKIIRDLAAEIHLCEWSGQCKKFYLTRDRGTLAFWGKFFYGVSNLSADIVKAFMLLAKFGEFAGIGRLTGQGFGQVRTTFISSQPRKVVSPS